MTTMLLLLAQGWTVDVRGSDVKVTGPAGSTLEFRRRVNRLEDGKLRSGLADEVVVRTLEGPHVESFERPGPVELKATSPDGRVFEASVRAGSAAAVVAWAKAGLKRITAAAGGLRELNLKSERAKRRLAAWRASGEASELPAAGQALAALAGDVEQALAAQEGSSPLLSAMDGQPFVIESLAERCAALVDLAERERDLLILDALNAAADDAHALALSGDPRRWARAEAGLRRSREHLAGAAGGRLSALCALALELIEIGGAAAECLEPNEEELERRHAELKSEARRLDDELRN